jgi:hypothetical protein
VHMLTSAPLPCATLPPRPAQHMNALSNRGRWLRKQGFWPQAIVFFAFCLGGAAMITIGKWA